MSKRKTIKLPAQIIGYQRAEALLKTLQTVRELTPRTSLKFDWSEVKVIAPAGYAILACLFDSIVEQKRDLENSFVKKQLKEMSVVKNLLSRSEHKSLPPPSIHDFEDPDFIVCGGETASNMAFLERFNNKWPELNEDLVYACRLALTELMQNTIDHSTAERYYIYAGKWRGELHAGVLDMGTSIPAKMEQKYTCENDGDYIEKALQNEVTTRRRRAGGLGLFRTFDFLKNREGKFVILSRNGHLRKRFKQRKTEKETLKYRLYGTWCFAIFPWIEQSNDDNSN